VGDATCGKPILRKMEIRVECPISNYLISPDSSGNLHVREIKTGLSGYISVYGLDA